MNSFDSIFLYCKPVFISNKELVFFSNKIIFSSLSFFSLLYSLVAFTLPFILTSHSDHCL